MQLELDSRQTAGPTVSAFRTEGMGNSSYVLVHDGLAMLVDPQRDYRRFLDGLDADLRWILETHLHNDYVSGGLAAATETGAELILPAGAGPAFRHTPAFHGEDLGYGGLTIRPLHTPGHTPEHTSYLILVDGAEVAVFSGGSLLAGSSGRSDLLSDARADTLARLQFRSIHRLALLRDETALLPTHGAGSFCAASVASGNVSTIEQERRSNPGLTVADEEAFVDHHLSGLDPHPDYYSRIRPINLAGPPPLPDGSPPQVSSSDLPADATLIDIRPPGEFASGHLPGSVNIPLSDQFGTWFGWLVASGEKTFIVARNPEDVAGALTQLHRIGLDDLAGSVTAPSADSTVVSRVGRLADMPDGAQILDVRSPGERREVAPAWTHHRYLPDLRMGPPPELDPTEPVWVMCSGGYRAAIAASLLRLDGFDAVPVLDAGIQVL